MAAGSFPDTKTQEYTPEDFRFTTKGNNLYAIELVWPSGNEAVIHSVAGTALRGRQIQAVKLLGSSAPLTYKLQADGLHIQLPAKPPKAMPTHFRSRSTIRRSSQREGSPRAI